MKPFFNQQLAVATICAVVAATPVRASVIVTGTRVIYAQPDREVTVRLTNDGRQPALVQAWIDSGDGTADPATIKVPFTLTPPMFRIDPTKGQSLRIIYDQEPLPGDKESVFWLNVLEVQPRPKTPGANTMQYAVRSRIKLFFRPAGLAGKSEDAPARLRWSVSSDAKGGRLLHVSNPTSFHVSFSGASVTVGGVTYENRTGGMVGPGAAFDFPVTRAANPVAVGAAQPVRFFWVNDSGAVAPAQAPLGGGI